MSTIYVSNVRAQTRNPDGEPPGTAVPGRSFLSMDDDGRVVRLDTFSKVLAPGLRVGWAAAPPALASKLTSALMANTLGPPSVSQVRAGVAES